jgi:hypothetical protein
VSLFLSCTPVPVSPLLRILATLPLGRDIPYETNPLLMATATDKSWKSGHTYDPSIHPSIHPSTATPLILSCPATHSTAALRTLYTTLGTHTALYTHPSQYYLYIFIKKESQYLCVYIYIYIYIYIPAAARTTQGCTVAANVPVPVSFTVCLSSPSLVVRSLH